VPSPHPRFIIFGQKQKYKKHPIDKKVALLSFSIKRHISKRKRLEKLLHSFKNSVTRGEERAPDLFRTTNSEPIISPCEEEKWFKLRL